MKYVWLTEFDKTTTQTRLPHLSHIRLHYFNFPISFEYFQQIEATRLFQKLPSMIAADQKIAEKFSNWIHSHSRYS